MRMLSKYDPIPRGKCPLCQDYVWTDQSRNKDDKGVYRHHKCPRRMAGAMRDLELMDRDLVRRAKRYESMSRPNHVFGRDSEERHLLAGFKLYLQLPTPRAPIEAYGSKQEEKFRWTLSKLHNELTEIKEADPPSAALHV